MRLRSTGGREQSLCLCRRQRADSDNGFPVGDCAADDHISVVAAYLSRIAGAPLKAQTLVKLKINYGRE